MGHFRSYELSPGFLVATVFWGILFLINPQNGIAQNRLNQTAESKVADVRLANYPISLAVFTGVLALSTIGL